MNSDYDFAMGVMLDFPTGDRREVSEADSDRAEQPFVPGQHVRYVPYHADGNTSHPDCENGVVTSIRTHSVVDGSPMEPPIIFVRFRGETAQGCMPDQLR